MMKTIFRILLLVGCVCGPLCSKRSEVQTYEAEENSDVSVEWRFPSSGNVSVDLLKIHCVVGSDPQEFYHLDNSIDMPQHERFAGRVRCDKDALRGGLVRLHLYGARTDDSGMYLCRMVTEYGKKINEFQLRITEVFAAQTYEAEENSDVLVEWRFLSSGNVSVDLLKIHCVVGSDHQEFYHLDNGVDMPRHERFAGRVRCDKDALRGGLVRLHLHGARTDDSGMYLCRMVIENGTKIINEFELRITAVTAWPEPERPKQGGINVGQGLVLLAGLIAVLVALCLLIIICGRNGFH